jgi:hypothetical protein
MSWIQPFLFSLSPFTRGKPRLQILSEELLAARRDRKEKRKDLFWFLDGGDNEDGEELTFADQVQDSILVSQL